MAWIWLFIAGLFECAWAIGLKYSDGLRKPLPALATAVAMGISLWLLSVAMRTIPVGTAYAVWTGIGAACVAVLGMVLFDEPRTPARIACLFLIVSGVVGLRVFGAAAQA